MTTNNNDIKVPVTLISGFLGAGKNEKKIAVIQNEYGSGIGIETAMIRGEDGSKVSEWLEFPNGCICCTVKDDFLKSVEDLLKRKDKFDYILIESTGMGDPGQISSSLWVDDELGSPVYLDSIITVVDCKNILRQIDEHDNPMPNDKMRYSSEAERQIAFGDVILLNKVDLVDDKQLAEINKRIKEINPFCKIIQTTRSVVSLDSVLNIKSYTPNLEVIKSYLDVQNNNSKGNNEHGECNHDHDHTDGSSCSDKQHNHSSRVNTICLESEGSIDLIELNRWIGSLVWEDYKDRIFRMKGLVAVKGEQEKRDWNNKFDR
ncbi:COBW domain-containing protein [Heterostelium album PN500]|uniref:COBW domain-containing protein n=1 Tax=Heterostelium pallidum (strain ATCC 26659 / Pp 5 / PN500) TaxID=670386 RepID=D3BM05_HETP5|nr:COBW domain-containing protein [Heterostelium album PN500]EFA77606.1 COBW domain-containing protein [Heterostelium album PN500]|eukprot:XP_020429734.1 COBW domain-containing protein [Heterostelium album PN500]